MKLELKHLAPYLPYGLKILYHGDQRKMNAGNGSSINWIGITATLQRQSENCKPILRSLSDLTKEIEVNGKRFVPYLFWDDKDRIELISCCATDVIYCEYLEYFIMQKLFEWHFDVFGLIENGLAIDINTLNKT